MHQENSALPESAPRRDIELESFAHKSSGGFVRRLTLPDGRWWFPADDICRGLGLADVRHALAAYVPDSMHATLDSVCALHRMPQPNQPTWAGTLPLLTRRGVEALFASPAGAGAPTFAAWVRATVICRSEGTVVRVPPEIVRTDAIEISSFVCAATGASIRRLTLPDGVHWFPAVDLCSELGYSNSRQAVADHVAAGDMMPLATVRTAYGCEIPSGRRWRRDLQMINMRGLIALVNSCQKPAAAPFKMWAAGVIATIQRDGQYSLLGAQRARSGASEPAAGVEVYAVDTLLKFLQKAEERQGRAVERLEAHLAVADERADRIHARMDAADARAAESHRVFMESYGKFIDALSSLMAKPRAPQRAAPHAKPVRPSAPRPVPPTPPPPTPPPTPPMPRTPLAPPTPPGPRVPLAPPSPPGPRTPPAPRTPLAPHSAPTLPPPAPPTPRGRRTPPAPPAPPAPQGPRSAPEILAAWQALFEAPEEVWSVAAYVIPEMLLHGELVAVGERIGARLGIAASHVHRCLGYLRRHGCIRQVGLTPGVGCPVYVFA